MSKKWPTILLTALITLPIGVALGFVAGIYSGDFAARFVDLVADSESWADEVPADVDHPIAFSSRRFAFQYPGNWTVSADGDDISIDSPGGSYVLLKYSEQNTNLEKLLADDLSYFKSEIANASKIPFNRWGQFDGAGHQLSGDFDNSALEVKLFASSRPRGAFSIVECCYAENKADALPGFQLIARTLKLNDGK